MRQDYTLINKKIKGSLFGGAIGDALGYPVDFLSENEIKQKYGKDGITQYQLTKKGVAEISDDTQMSLFTANGMLSADSTGFDRKPHGTYADIWQAYCNWYQTQKYISPFHSTSWLTQIPKMCSRRAPGNTCMSALEVMDRGERVENNSKGCGGIMRVAPLATYTYRHYKHTSVKEVIGRSAYIAYHTHHHPLGFLPAGALGGIIYKLMERDGSKEPLDLKQVTDGVMRILPDVQDIHMTKQTYGEHYSEQIRELYKITDKAFELAERNDISETEAIKEIGEGWTAEETLAIALYCCAKHPNDFDKAVISSVNHSGDSDSTGAVTGNIMGAYLSMDGISDKWLENLELKEVINEIADDLGADCPLEYGKPLDGTEEKRRWKTKYIDCNPYVNISKANKLRSFVTDFRLVASEIIDYIR